MLKKRALRHINLATVFTLLIFGNLSSQTPTKDGCYLMIGNKHISLFADFAAIRKEIPVRADIEYLDKSVLAYVYDGKISREDKYTVTQQVGFFVDTVSKKIVRQKVYYSIERHVKDGFIPKSDLSRLLTLIKNQAVPFLQIPINPDFGSKTTGKSDCHIYDLEITKPNIEASASSLQEVYITVSIGK